MASKIDRYLLRDGDDLTAELFNPVFRDLDNRVTRIEDKAVSYDKATQDLVEAALNRLDQIMSPVVDRFSEYASLGALLTAHSDSSIETGDGVKIFVIDEDDRQKFAPSAYLAIVKTGDPTQAMLGMLVAYNADNGQLTVNVDRFEGAGFHGSWTITAGSATDNAAAIPAVAALKAAAETAAGQAASRRNEAEAARDAALEYRDDAEDFKDIAHAEAETADDARNQAQIAQTATELARDQALAYMEGFLGTFVSTAIPTTRQDGSALQKSDWGFKRVVGTPDTYFIDYVASIGPVVWRSLTAAADTSVTSFNGRVGGVNPVTGDYTAGMITATAISGLTGTDVQTILASIKTALDTKAPVATTVTGAGLATGGGDLSANRTITVPAASQAEAEAGVDNAKAMTALRVKQSIVANAPAPAAASETVAGIVELATSAETITGTDTTRAVHPAGLKSMVDARFNALTGAAPAALDTLAEIAAALDNNGSYAAAVTAALATKLASSSYTAADVMAKVQSLDGAGSGLDADLLDGLHAASFARVDNGDVNFPGIVAAANNKAGLSNSGGYVRVYARTAGTWLERLAIPDTGDPSQYLIYDQPATAWRNLWHSGNFTPGNKAETSTSISAGTGLAGGGSLAASRTLSFDTTWGDARYAAAGHVGAGGTAHAAATTSVAGFQSAADKTKLDAIRRIGQDTPLDDQTFDASGTWTKPAVAGTLAVIEMWGGGAGGGRDTTGWARPGGEGGTYRCFVVPFAALPPSEPVYVGAGGAGRTGNYNNLSGSTGGGSVFLGAVAWGGIGQLTDGEGTPYQNVMSRANGLWYRPFAIGYFEAWGFGTSNAGWAWRQDKTTTPPIDQPIELGSGHWTGNNNLSQVTKGHHGGGAGGSITNGNVVIAPWAPTGSGGAGGAANASGAGANGSVPGGGGGAGTNANGGNGGGGRVRIRIY